MAVAVPSVAVPRLRRKAANLASVARFAGTRVRPATSSLAVLRTVYGHRLGLPRDLAGRTIQVRPYDTWRTFTLPPGSSLSLVLAVLHERAYDPSDDISATARTIVDCGANVGLSALYLADRYKRATVHAFEPCGANFAALRQNVSALGERVVANQVGVASANGTATLQLSGNNEYHSLRPDGRADARADQEQVRLIRLEEYLKEHDIERVDLLKLDVEGAELDALMGLGPRIRDVYRIVGELHLTWVDEDAFQSFLREHGFAYRARLRPATAPVVMFEAVRG